MWKYNTTRPPCLYARVGMEVTWRKNKVRTNITRIRDTEEWMGCRYHMNWMIYTNMNNDRGYGPIYFDEFDCLNCRYVVKSHVRFLDL